MKKIVLVIAALAVTVTAAEAQNPVSDGIRSSWNGVKRNISESAEQMPEAVSALLLRHIARNEDAAS